MNTKYVLHFLLGNGKWVPPPDDTLRYYSYQRNDEAKNIWLFNITNDPLEKYDLSDSYPDIVKTMLDRLSAYNATAVPVRYPPPDPECNPELHGDAWVPWRD